jgi:hypothetical protein
MVKTFAMQVFRISIIHHFQKIFITLTTVHNLSAKDSASRVKTCNLTELIREMGKK